MSGERYRFRVNPTLGEIEIEGTEEFVDRYWNELHSLVARVPVQHDEVEASEPSAAPIPAASQSDGVPETFGEYFNLFEDLSGTDEVLVAGYYHQMAVSEEDVFTTNEANELLKEQRVKVANASQSVQRNLSAKKVFKIGRAYRVSRQGEEYIRGLLDGVDGSA